MDGDPRRRVFPILPNQDTAVHHPRGDNKRIAKLIALRAGMVDHDPPYKKPSAIQT